MTMYITVYKVVKEPDVRSVLDIVLEMVLNIQFLTEIPNLTKITYLILMISDGHLNITNIACSMIIRIPIVITTMH